MFYLFIYFFIIFFFFFNVQNILFDIEYMFLEQNKLKCNETTIKHQSIILFSYHTDTVLLQTDIVL
jgi:hypothetical protein